MIMKWIDRFLFVFFGSLLLVALTALFLHCFGEDLILEQVRLLIQKRVTARVTFSEYRINWFTMTAEVHDVTFHHKEKKSTIKNFKVRFGFPNIFRQILPIREMYIEDGVWIIHRKDKKASFFPDFITDYKDGSKWKVTLDKIILLNYDTRFIDEDILPNQDITLTSRRGTVVVDRVPEIIRIKGILEDKTHKDSRYFCRMNFGMKSKYTDFDVSVFAKDCDFTRVGVYQVEFTNLKIKEGTGSYILNLENHLGLLKGYLYVNAFNLNFDAFNESIFSTVLGLSYQSFLGMMEKNNKHLELDFMIYGEASHPKIRLGALAKGFLLKAPVSLAKDTFSLVEKVFNTALLGLPRKIYGNKSEKDAENKDGAAVPEEEALSELSEEAAMDLES